MTMVNKKIVDEKNGKLCKCLFRVLLLLSVVTSACAKENGSPTVVLRFSRSGNEVIEGQFSTHYVDKFWGMRD